MITLQKSIVLLSDAENLLEGTVAVASECAQRAGTSPLHVGRVRCGRWRRCLPLLLLVVLLLIVVVVGLVVVVRISVVVTIVEVAVAIVTIAVIS